MGIKTVQDTSLTSVANAIRVKAEISGTLEFPDEFVSAIQNISTGITPSGTKTITENGTYDVTDYASADVQTPQPSGSISITQNGTVDVSQYASANVNVSGGGGGDDTLKRLIEGTVMDIVIPSGTTEIRDRAFYNLPYLRSVTMPNSLRTIGKSAFWECRALKNITIPSSVTEIGEEAFRGCQALTSVTIPSSVTSFGKTVFYDCGGLTSVILPGSISAIPNYTFYNCIKLMNITVNRTTPPTLANSAFNNVPANANIYVPAESVEAYKAASNWSSRAAYIQAIPE